MKGGKYEGAILENEDKVLPLAAAGDFGAIHCQPSTSFVRSTVIELTTIVSIEANGCCAFVLFYRIALV